MGSGAEAGLWVVTLDVCMYGPVGDLGVADGAKVNEIFDLIHPKS